MILTTTHMQIPNLPAHVLLVFLLLFLVNPAVQSPSYVSFGCCWDTALSEGTGLSRHHSDEVPVGIRLRGLQSCVLNMRVRIAC